MSEDEPATPACPSCGSKMKLARITPKLAGLPKLLTFQCLTCEEVLTIED